jgi:hypothetical protein
MVSWSTSRPGISTERIWAFRRSTAARSSARTSMEAID